MRYLVLLLIGAAHAAGPAEIELVRGGKRYELSAAAQARIAEDLPRLFATCSVNSRDHAHLLPASNTGALWQETSAHDHLRLRFAAPIEVGHPHLPAISARELLIGLASPRLPSPELSRNGDEVIAHGKCSGGDTIRFVCTPELKPLMPSSYHESCALLEKATGRPSP